jgi:hypothetical protein
MVSHTWETTLNTIIYMLHVHQYPIVSQRSPLMLEKHPGTFNACKRISSNSSNLAYILLFNIRVTKRYLLYIDTRTKNIPKR